MATEYRLTTALGDDEFLFAKLVGRERLGEPFRYEFHLLSENAQIDFDRLIGTPVSLAFRLGSDSPAAERHFSGIITQIAYAGGARA